MQKTSKIYVAGHCGMVGSAIVRALTAQGYGNLIVKPHSELDLTDRHAVKSFFAKHEIEYVFLAAAKVGGILANDQFGGDFIRENLLIQVNVIEEAYRSGVQKLLFLGSSCIYPRLAPQPIKERSLLTGEMEPTNLPYAVAKIAGKTMCDAYRKQYGFNAFTVMPSNVYGVGDNFDPQNSHVVAGLMQKFHAARIEGKDKVVAWGTGSPMRELINADDLADACIYLMNNYEGGGLINAGSNQEVSIKELTELLRKVVDFKGELGWDNSKPDGTPRKIMDNSKLFGMGWRPRVLLQKGLEDMYAWYIQSIRE